MSLAKLKKIHVIIIGSVLCVIAAAAMFFLLIKPQNEALAKVKADYDATIVLGNPASETKANADLSAAIVKVASTQQKLDLQMRNRMPYLNFARRDIGMLSLWNEQIKTLGPLLEGFAHDKNVNLISANFSLPAPPVNPNDTTFDNDVLIFPLGTVQVQGDFKSLMKNICRWNNCKRLVMVSQPTLQGNSPELVASYTVTCYIFPAAKGGAKIPMAGDSTTGAAGATGAAPVATAMSPAMPPR